MKKLIKITLILLCVLSLSGFKNLDSVDYSLSNNWAYLAYGKNKAVDVFILCPTVDLGTDTRHNMDINDEKTKQNFVGALNMQLGIYSQTGSIYAPYYRQMTLSAYAKSNYNDNLDIAYEDVKDAFIYYFENYNQGKPFILAGFSQGSQLGIKLMQDLFSDPKYSDKLIAAYLIGWGITADMIKTSPFLKMAQSETDTGVIISFNSETPDIKSSLIVPQGVKTLAINPLNWKTNSTPAKAKENIAACFTDYSGTIKKQIPHLTGAYLDKNRGTLKVPDIKKQDYPPIIPLFMLGEYHIYDYQFFYKNLQENVAKRTTIFFTKQKAA